MLCVCVCVHARARNVLSAIRGIKLHPLERKAANPFTLSGLVMSKEQLIT